MTRYLERIARVWEAISAAEGFDMVGFCLDTCHAHAGGNDLATVVEDVVEITGRIDLVHCNDSRDEFDSGADRHANFGAGPDRPRGRSPRSSATPVRPVVCETPGRRRGAPGRLRLAARAAVGRSVRPGRAAAHADRRAPGCRTAR